MVSQIKTLIRDEGFLIRSVVFGEHDRILSFLTRDHGRIDVMVPAERKSLKRFSGILDFLNHLQLEYQKNQRGGLHRLVQARLLEGFNGIRSDCDQIWLVLRWLRILARTLPSEGAVLPVYSLLESSLKALSRRDPIWVDLVFRRGLLSAMGFHLQLAACVHCGCSDRDPYCFELARGGLLCSSCQSGTRPKSALKVFPEAWWSLALEDSPWSEPRIREALKILAEGFYEFLGMREEEGFAKAVRESGNTGFKWESAAKA